MTRPFHAAVSLVVAVAFLLPVVTSGPARASDHKNEIKGLAFNPEQITVRAGDSVTWVNEDSDRHHLLGEGFESKDLANGATFTTEFPEPAQLAYHCTIHTYMEGRIVVLNPDGSVPPTTAGEPEAPPAPSTTTSSTRPPGPLDGLPTDRLPERS
ncbi:MAG TPA: plastocyanin/azurin family copper-binding protein [Acidimicrobiia bacterium]|jgi:plastocyanin|nr:plastocyanin/azurin family copper-binding protein [Acidimicrobiia bacterium]